MGEFCLIAKISSEIWKKWSKKGKKLVKYIFWPSHMINNNICNIFSFLVFFFLVLYKPFAFAKFSEISSENRVQKLGKRISKKNKNVTNVIMYCV